MMAKIEVIIPVHSVERPIGRAVESVLGSDSDELCVTVVCHNVSIDSIAAQLPDPVLEPRLRLLEYKDEVRSAAGPRNFSITHAIGDYLTFLDSDDFLEQGAIDHWRSELDVSPDLLVGQLSSDAAGRMLAPLPRTGRFRQLDPVRDLLNYRTTLQGVLIRRSILLGENGARYREGFRIGEDILIGLQLWNSAKAINYSCRAPGYVLCVGGDDRVTSDVLSGEESLSPVSDALNQSSLRRLRRRQRQAIGVKLLRVQVLEWVKSRHAADTMTQEVLDSTADTITAIRDFASGTNGYLNLADLRIVRSILTRDLARLDASLQRAAQTHYFWKIPAINPFRTFAPESFFVRSRRARRLASTLRP